MTSSLFPVISVYLLKRNLSVCERQSGTNGALIGVGLEVGFDVSLGGTSEDLVVVSPVLGGPAGRAGIVPGDVILAIDGVPTKGMGLYDAARRLQ